MTTTRREFILQGLSVGLIWPPEAISQGSFSEEELDELFEADAEETPAGFKGPKKVARWSALPSRPQAKWPSRSKSVDFRHIAALAPVQMPDSFHLTGAVLHKLAVLNSFDLNRSREHILFGLRGCSSMGVTPNGFVRSVQIAESVPDHVQSKCLIGVWRPDQGDLWITNGSTVPNIEYMYQMMKGGLPCNMLPTGLHRYQVGTHRAGSRFPQSGAFRQLDPVPVLRNRNNLSFELPPLDKFDASVNLIVADNIHAGFLEHSSRPPYFSSAGCQVIPGGYLRDQSGAAYGRWAVFRERAGLGPPAATQRSNGSTPDDGRIFLYMLLTGAEARLVAQGQSSLIGPTIRFGSSGKHIMRLRDRFGIMPYGTRVDQVTMLALLRWQMEQLGYSDGIIDPTAEAAILVRS